MATCSEVQSPSQSLETPPLSMEIPSLSLEIPSLSLEIPSLSLETPEETPSLSDSEAVNEAIEKPELKEQLCDKCQEEAREEEEGEEEGVSPTFLDQLLCLRMHDENDDWVANQSPQVDQVESDQVNESADPRYLAWCSKHGKPLEIFCETCEELVCYLCTVKKHKDHDHDVVDDAYAKPKLRKLIQQSSLQPLNQKIGAITAVMDILMGRKVEITEQGDKVKAKKHEAIAQIKELLDETDKKMDEEVDEAVKYKLTITDQQIKKAEALLDQLTQSVDYIQQSIAEDTPHQVLISTKAQMVSHVARLLSGINEEAFLPLEQANFSFATNDRLNIKHIPSYVGTIEYSITATPTATISISHTPVVGEESTVNMSLSLEDGSPAPVPLYLISCYLTPPCNDSARAPAHVQCTVKGTSQTGQYSVVFTPCTRGSHQLYVKLNDRIIPGNPVSIPVTFPVNARGDVVKTITGLKDPFGVAVRPDDGQVFISECQGHCISTITRNGKKAQPFRKRKGPTQLSSPMGTAITSRGTLLISDWGNNRLQEFTMDGRCIFYIGSKGSGPLQFYGPRGIAINKTTGQVYIADTENHRVQVLNADLTFSHVIGCYGSGQGELECPVDVAIDSQGLVYVADTNNIRIQRFTPEGRFDSLFDTKGSEPGQITWPHCLAIDNDLLYISEGMPNHRISVFTTSGEFVYCFGAGKMEGSPWGMALDKNTGFLYVCNKNQVTIF